MMTLTEARKLARKARQYGYFQLTATKLQVRCPLCRADVATEVFAWAKPSERMSALDAAVVAHVRDDCQ